MSQSSIVLGNQSASDFRTALNNALAAIQSNQSGSSAPSPTYANMFFYDETNSRLWMRNSTNSGWIAIIDFDQSGSTSAPIISAGDAFSAGAIFYGKGDGLRRLPIGAAGQVLRVNGLETHPIWEDQDGLVTISQTTISNDASVDFQFTATNYTTLFLDFANVTLASGASDYCQLLLGENGTVDTNLANYSGVRNYVAQSTTINSVKGSSPPLAGTFTGGSGNNEGGFSGRIVLENDFRFFQYHTVLDDPTNGPTCNWGHAFYSGPSDVDTIRLKAISNNLATGVVTLSGITAT